MIAHSYLTVFITLCNAILNRIIDNKTINESIKIAPGLKMHSYLPLALHRILGSLTQE